MRIKIAAMAFLSLAGSALAADLPSTKMAPPPYAPPPPPMWTGFYIGAFGGYGAGDLASRTTSYQQFLPGFDVIQGFNQTDRVGGGLAGGTIGYNWQFSGNMVAGLEVDGGWADVRTSNNNSGFNSAAGLVTANSGNTSIGLDWLGTARVRLGYAMGNFLPYITGGVAFGGLSSNINAVTVTPVFPGVTFLGVTSQTGSSTSVGWAAGAGMEYLITPSWSVKAEYLYTELGSVTAQGVTVTSPATPLTFISTTSGNFGFHSVRAGLNYHFNWGGSAPILAKY